MKIQHFVIVVTIMLGSFLKAQDQLHFGNFSMSYTPPEGFVRYDDTQTDLAEMAKAAVPSSNALLGAYVDKANALGAKGGKPVTHMPYFMCQIIRQYAIAGLKGKKPEEIIATLSKQSDEILSIAKLEDLSAIRRAIEEKAKPRVNGINLLAPQLTSVGLLERGTQHVTFLLMGNASAEIEGVVTKYNLIATMTVEIVNGIPIFLYVYDDDDGSSLEGTKIKALTSRIRKGITQSKPNNTDPTR
jgi:hypothetical protein